MLDPIRLFREEFSEFVEDDACIAVSPDVGATELITDFAEQMGIRSAIAHKVRPAPEELEVADLIGDFRGKKRAIILDDIVSSSGTLTQVARKLVEETKIEEVYVGVSHNLCTEKGLENFRRLYDEGILKRLITTDTIPQTDDFLELPFFSVHSLAEDFARVINRLHYNRSVSEIFRAKR
jgi:ribose-phosphate pyrophosphokinase